MEAGLAEIQDRAFIDFLGTRGVLTVGIFPLLLLAVKTILFLGMVLKDALIFEIQTLFNFFPTELFPTKIQKSYTRSVSVDEGLNLQDQSYSKNSGVFNNFLHQGGGVYTPVYEGGSTSFNHIEECLDCPQLDYDTSTQFYSRNPYVPNTPELYTRTNPYVPNIPELQYTRTNELPTSSYSQHLDELLDYYTQEYNRKRSVQNSLVETNIYSNSKINPALYSPESIYGQRNPSNKLVRFPDSYVDDNTVNTDVLDYLLENKNDESLDYAFNTVPNQFLVPDNYIVTKPDNGRDKNEPRLILKVPAQQPPTSSVETTLTKGPPITYQSLLQTRMTNSQLQYLESLKNSEQILSRSNIFRAHSKKNAAENFESPRVVRTELRSSEPENAENGSWSGSKEWANKIYPLLKNQ